MKHLTPLLLVIMFLISGNVSAKSLLENCSDKKLKDYKIKNLVTIAEEGGLMRKFRAECAKYTFTTPQEKQALAAEAQAAERQAKLDKEAKEKKEAAAKAPVTKPPVAIAPVAKPQVAVAPVSAGSGSSQPVFGGCGTDRKSVV